MMALQSRPALIASIALVSIACAAPFTQKKKPHVISLVIDDVGWADVGYHGSNFPTPNIDALVKSGVELSHMYAMPQCSPTRAAIMTGRYSFHTGMQHFTTIMPGATAGIPQKTPTVAEVMSEAGYDTHAIGKWHLGYSSWSQTPIKRGFNSYLGYLQGQTDYYNRTIPSCAAAICLYRNNKKSDSPYGVGGAGEDFWRDDKLALEDHGRYTMDSYMARLDEILKPYGSPNPPDKPLYLYFAEQLLHIPLQAPPEARHLEACRNVTGGNAMVNRTILCSMASRLDESIGNLERMLKKYNMYEDTVVWVFSDNGGMTQWGDQFPASASSNYPLRGGKTTVFQGGVRSVSFVFGGAVPTAARGTRRSELMHAVDILPTMAALGGATLPKDVDGIDMWSTITGTAPSNRTELPLQIAVNRDLNPLGGIPSLPKKNDHIANYTALIQWPYKLILGDSYMLAGLQDLRPRDGWWSVEGYTYTPPPPEAKLARLYNLELDETEEHDVAAKFPDIVSRMRDRVDKVWTNKEHGYVRPQINIPMPLGNPKFHNWTWAPFRPLL